MKKGTIIIAIHIVTVSSFIDLIKAFSFERQQEMRLWLATYLDVETKKVHLPEKLVQKIWNKSLPQQQELVKKTFKKFKPSNIC